MIDYTQFREAIEVFLRDNISTTTIIFENTLSDDRLLEHIEVTDQDITAEQMSMESDSPISLTGLLVIKIFTLLDTGTQRAKEIASEISTLIINTEIPGVNLSTPVLKAVGIDKRAPLYQHNLTINYQYFYGQDDREN